jgi:hypothetical protein
MFDYGDNQELAQELWQGFKKAPKTQCADIGVDLPGKPKTFGELADEIENGTDRAKTLITIATIVKNSILREKRKKFMLDGINDAINSIEGRL